MSAEMNMSTCPKIYEAVFDHCAPYVPLERWPEIAANSDCKTVPNCGSALSSHLLQEFSESELIESGVAEVVADGLVLTSALASGARPIIASSSSMAD